jgi:glycosyltransferase involved in cell wall biosynthesis
MRILYVDQTGKLGGGEVALLPWLLRAAEGARVVLFTDGPFRELIEQAGIPVDVIEQSSLAGHRRESGLSAMLGVLPGMLRIRKRLAALAREADLLYANSQKAFLVSALAKRRGQPLIWHLRDIMTADHFSPLMRRVAVSFGNRFASVVITNSQATADSFIAAGGRPEKVHVVHDGVSHIPFDHVDVPSVQALRKAICPPETPLIGVFGRLSHWKGQHIVLEAMSGLPELQVVFIGDALFGEDEYAASLHRRAAQPDLAGRVHFTGFRRDIPEWMKAVDIVLHSSTAPEPFGLVIVEGMLAGRPVIATRAGGAVEIIEDGVSGLLVDPGSAESIRVAVRRLCSDKCLVEQLSQKGRHRAETMFSVEKMAEGTENAVRSAFHVTDLHPRI